MDRTHENTLRLVRELMARPEERGGPVSSRYPVLVVSGSRGSGKTALLGRLAAAMDQKVPCARLDLESSRHATVAQLLSALAFQLGRHTGGYGQLRFPRLVVVTVVLDLDLRGHSRETAREEIAGLLRRQHNLDTVATFLEGTAAEVLSAVPLPTGVPPGAVGRVLAALVRASAGWRWSRGIVLGSYLDWFRHQDRELAEEPLDVLVDANLWHHTEDEDAGYRLEQLLCRAFLADLRAGFGAARRSRELSLNCAALLDNADSPLGRRFLDRLADTRVQTAPAPLTIVATTRGLLPEHLHPDETATLGAADRDYAQWQQRTGRLPRWLRTELPDLTEQEVRDLVTRLGSTVDNDRRLARTVYRFTDGHPAATRLLVDALRAHAGDRPGLADLLTRLEPPDLAQETRLPVADRLLRRLFQDHPAELDFPELTALADVVTCAAARAEDDGRWLAEQPGLRLRDRSPLPDLTAAQLWTGRTALARRLLLRRLAARPTGAKADWTTVFRTLRGHQPPDSVGARYYALAAEDLAAVAEAEAHRLPTVDTTTWLRELHETTSAPNRLSHHRPALDQAHALTSSFGTGDGIVENLARLVAALWLDADPLRRSVRGELEHEIGDRFLAVSRAAVTPKVLRDEASRYHRLAEQAS
ncbi:hypothetical protein JOF53_001249 [Crossiella equi]|uniref:AAA+ ATPase domain-containing protein n=1 Tax=Crossiella equi TaxID=130796 RepID=A0ABS5A7Y8_9PSEU|nr:hypothetical protein [Crossiella equi]MBP2472377.1 hypothetical protein [Crossiella equi]